MTKVVFVVKGSVVQEVLSDGEDVKVLVLDRDPAAGKEYLLADVLGEPAALAALMQGAVTLNAQRTQQAFEESLQCVTCRTEQVCSGKSRCSACSGTRRHRG